MIKAKTTLIDTKRATNTPRRVINTTNDTKSTIGTKRDGTIDRDPRPARDHEIGKGHINDLTNDTAEVGAGVSRVIDTEMIVEARVDHVERRRDRSLLLWKRQKPLWNDWNVNREKDELIITDRSRIIIISF
jgi:hypothetical protein